MYAQSLRSLWIQARWLMLGLSVICFAAPLMTVYAGPGSGGMYEVSAWLTGSERVGYAIPFIAFLSGMVTGITVWTADRAGGHVYALSLPISRPRFILLRFGAGATLLALPAAALGAGAVLAAASVHLPAGIHAYPVQLTVRFALAMLVCFAVFFSLAVATRRIALTLLVAGCTALVVDVLSTVFLRAGLGISETVVTLLVTWPGPLAILMGRWALFDV